MGLEVKESKIEKNIKCKMDLYVYEYARKIRVVNALDKAGINLKYFRESAYDLLAKAESLASLVDCVDHGFTRRGRRYIREKRQEIWDIGEKYSYWNVNS